MEFDEMPLVLDYRRLHADACQRWIEINFSPPRAVEFGTKLADAKRRVSSWVDVFERWDCEDWRRLVEMESGRLKHLEEELEPVKECWFDEDEETEEQFVKRTWPLRLLLINSALQRTNGDIMEHFMLASFRSPPGQPAGSIGATDEVMWDLMHIRDDCDMLAEVADWLKQLAKEIEPANLATNEFTPTIEDLNILGALAEAGETLILTEIAVRSGQSLKVVKKRVPVLEDLRLSDRPHGERKGRAITNAGRELLNSHNGNC
ncbi:MAG: hypothetical protein IID34_08340 [Planctomycetes bacterium]|nr:hypothetical protein [Planctomycetota bacterium]